MTIDTSKAPDLVNKSIRRVWIKNGHRRISTDGGWMELSSRFSRKLFGNYKQGRYSKLQDK